MNKLHLIAKENKVFKNKISCLLYKEIFIDKEHEGDWIEIELNKNELYGLIFKE